MDINMVFIFVVVVILLVILFGLNGFLIVKIVLLFGYWVGLVNVVGFVGVFYLYGMLFVFGIFILLV